MSYDEKFRRHILKAREEEGLSLTKVAKRFGIAKRLLEKKKRERMPQKGTQRTLLGVSLTKYCKDPLRLFCFVINTLAI